MIGRTFGRYRIVAPLGEGGMGSVWRAEDPSLGRTVAIKLLSPTLWMSANARQRFLMEARAAARLEHPGIAAVYDVDESGELAWIAYQFIDGESLAARSERGPLPLAEARALALDAAEALEHAHERGVLHRDITAGNLMVTREGRAVLVDFGLARSDQGPQLTATGDVIGTIGYMAPEVLRGAPADVRSDLYGLGAVLYRMLTGRLPFEGDPARVLKDTAPPPSDLRPDLPPAFERIVLRLLERERAKRYASAGDVVSALQQVTTGRVPSRLHHARRRIAWSTRLVGEILWRRRAGIALLAGIIAVGASVWFATQRGWLTAAPRAPILAVLPFRNETDDPDETAYIADGLAEALATNLAQTERLSVLPWVTTERVRPDRTPLRRLAKDLNARKLLLGTLRSTPQGLAVSLSLVDGTDGSQTWSRQFEGSADQLPSLEARMLFEAATALLGTLRPEERSRMALPSGRDGRAYNLYLEGASNLSAGDPNSLDVAEQFFKRSLELDSTFADAHVGLGAVYNSRYFMGIEGGKRNIEIAREEFGTASRLDPSSPFVMRAILSLYWQEEQSEECVKLGRRAAGTKPQTADLRIVTEEAYVLGKLPEIGLQLGEEILSVDPSNPPARFWAVLGAAWAGEPKKVLLHGSEYIRRFGEYFEIYEWMGLAALRLHQPGKALAFVHRAEELEGDSRDPRVIEFVATTEQIALGPDRARESWLRLRDVLRARLKDVPDQPRNRIGLMYALVMLGDRDGALAEWQILKTRFANERSIGSGDVTLLPYWLVKLGAREEARQAIAAIETRGIGMDAGSENLAHYEVELLGVGDDPLIRQYEAYRRRRYADFRQRFAVP